MEASGREMSKHKHASGLIHDLKVTADVSTKVDVEMTEIRIQATTDLAGTHGDGRAFTKMFLPIDGEIASAWIETLFHQLKMPHERNETHLNLSGFGQRMIGRYNRQV